jgi:type VI secretion system protein ImpL
MSREDFARLFGTGGLLDAFFQRNLAPYVDMSTRPWTYRRAEGAARTEGADALLPFQRAQAIRDTYFRDGGRTFGARLEFRLIELDEGLAQFALDIDGQVLRFSRDTKTALSATWPGSAAASRVRVAQGPAAGGPGTGYLFEGPWALLRLFDRVRVEPGATPDRARLVFDVEGRKARFEVRSSTPLNPLLRQDLEQFECPKRL